MPSTGLLGPGTLVRDSLAPTLQNGNITANTTGAATEVNKPAEVRFEAKVTGTVTGTSPTLDIEVQASDSSSFASGVVSLGRFKQLVAADASSAVTHYLQARCYKRYVRIVATVGGTTPVFNGVQVRAREAHDRLTDTATA